MVLLFFAALFFVADAADWQTRWGDCSVPCGSGTRSLEVHCADDYVVVEDGACDLSSKPATSIACDVTCIFVDPAVGDDTADGAEDTPLRTLGACIQRFGQDLSSSKTMPAETLGVVRCALKSGVYAEEVSTELAGVDHLLVEPAESGNEVLFDGTDELRSSLQGSWSAHGALGDVVQVSPVLSDLHRDATLRPHVIVAGQSIMCANQTAIADGGHGDKPGYQTLSPPCFLWSPESAWVDGGRAFSAADAVKYFEQGDDSWIAGADQHRRLPWFWFSEASGRLYVDRDRSPGDVDSLSIRIKNSSRADVFQIGDASHRIYARDLNFFGTACCGNGPGDVNKNSQDLRLERSRFLYAPLNGVRVKTTKKSGRGSGSFARVVNSTFEFGEAGLKYKATGASMVGNYFAFNSFEVRGDYTVHSLAMRSLFSHNTLLYNGDKGTHFNWARGNRCTYNLIIGQDFLGPWFDAAIFHTITSAQEGLLVERNWAFGPSLVSFTRLDTAQGTTPAQAGRYTVVRHNVHFGLGITLKGYNHTCEHNTGSKLLIVESWAAISNHNYASVVRYNAHSVVTARGSTQPHSAIPGYASLNVCQDLQVCNPGNETAWLTPDWMALQFQEGRAVQGVSQELVGPVWSGLDSSGVGEGLSENEAGVVDGKQLLGSKEPWELATPTAEGLDFRPKSDSRLILNCDGGAQCDADGSTHDYTDTKPTYTAFDTYVGAYDASDALWVPGCFACTPGGIFAGDVFPLPNQTRPSSQADQGSTSVSVSTTSQDSQGPTGSTTSQEDQGGMTSEAFATLGAAKLTTPSAATRMLFLSLLPGLAM